MGDFNFGKVRLFGWLLAHFRVFLGVTFFGVSLLGVLLFWFVMFGFVSSLGLSNILSFGDLFLVFGFTFSGEVLGHIFGLNLSFLLERNDD